MRLKKSHYALVLIIIILGLSLALYSQTLIPKNNLCNTGGAVKAFGFDFIGNDIVMKCDCLGEAEHKSSWNCLDCNWVECYGKIDYVCYKLNTTINEAFDIISPKGIRNQEFLSFVKNNSRVISCPPNTWMDIPCTNDSQCSQVGCPRGSDPYCESWGCKCGDPVRSIITGNITIPLEYATDPSRTFSNKILIFSIDENGTEKMIFEKYAGTGIIYSDKDTVWQFNFLLNETRTKMRLFVEPCHERIIDFDPGINNIVDMVIGEPCEASNDNNSLPTNYTDCISKGGYVIEREDTDGLGTTCTFQVTDYENQELFNECEAAGGGLFVNGVMWCTIIYPRNGPACYDNFCD